jgi:hypothetical protein
MPAIAEPPKPAAPVTPAPAPASPAPAPAPSAPSSPPTSPSPAPAAAAPAPEKPVNPFANIDKAVADFDKPRPTTSGKGAEPKPVPAPEVPKAPEPAKPVATAPELRKQYEQTKADLAAREASIAALETKIKDYEARGKETEALQARVKQLEADVEKKAGDLRAFRFEAGPDFKKEFERPWIDAGTNALQLVGELLVTDSETGEARQGQADDFKRLYQLNAGQAYAMARELFGDAGQLVMHHYFTVKGLEKKMNDRLAEEKANAIEKNKADEGARIVRQQTNKAVFENLNREMEETEKDYRDGPEETQFAELRKQGYAVFDHEAKPGPESMVKYAHIRQRVAAFPVLQAKLAQANAEIAKLKAENEALLNPQPQKNKNPGGKTDVPAPEESWEAGARKFITG